MRWSSAHYYILKKNHDKLGCKFAGDVPSAGIECCLRGYFGKISLLQIASVYAAMVII